MHPEGELLAVLNFVWGTSFSGRERAFLEVKCIICGRGEEITKLHKDYRKLARNKAVFTCELCQRKLKFEANLVQKYK
jgi:uncharacterized protein YlaI